MASTSVVFVGLNDGFVGLLSAFVALLSPVPSASNVVFVGLNDGFVCLLSFFLFRVGSHRAGSVPAEQV